MMKKFMSLVTLMSTVWSLGGGFAFASSVREAGARARMNEEKKVDQAASTVRQELDRIVKSGRYNGKNAVSLFRADYRRGLKGMKTKMNADVEKVLRGSDSEVEGSLDTILAKARELGNDAMVASIQEQRARGVSAREIIRSVRADEWEAQAVASIEGELAQAGGSPNKMLKKQIKRLTQKDIVYIVSAPAVFIVGGAVVWGVTWGFYGPTSAVVIAGETLFAIGLVGLVIWVAIIAVAINAY